MPADGFFQLAWSDGSLLPLSFWIEEPKRSSNSIVLNWRTVPKDNQPPNVDIITPTNGSHGPLGFAMLQAKVTDPEDGQNGLRIEWSSDVDGPLSAGSNTTYQFFSPGDRIITVTARDQFGAATRKSITYTVDKTPPSASISTPAQGGTAYRNIPVVLLGSGRTPVLFALPCSRLTWTIDQVNGWSMSPSDSDTGCTVTQTFDVRGPATFTLTVKDDYGGLGTASVSVNFVDPPPRVHHHSSLSHLLRGAVCSQVAQSISPGQ